MEALLKRRQHEYFNPDPVPLAVIEPPPLSFPEYHTPTSSPSPKRSRLDHLDFVNAQLMNDHHHGAAQLLMSDVQYPNLLQPHHHYSFVDMITPNSSSSSSYFYYPLTTTPSFNPGFHGEISTSAGYCPHVFTPGWESPLLRLLLEPDVLEKPPAEQVLALTYAGLLPGVGAEASALPMLVEEQELEDSLATARKAEKEKGQQRRKRIREKFRVLEKMLPTTKKLNKATLLEEACKYIRFMEAQVKALASMRHPAFAGEQWGSFSAAMEGPLISRDRVLEKLLNSAKTQAVLADKGWCVVTLEQAEALKLSLQNLILKQQLIDQAAPTAQTTQQHCPSPGHSRTSSSFGDDLYY